MWEFSFKHHSHYTANIMYTVSVDMCNKYNP